MLETSEPWTQSPYIVVLYYRYYSCGKFLSNILSFNNNFVPQIALTNKVKRWNSSIDILSDRKIFDSELEDFLKEYKIQEIFNTIPPTVEACRDWYEFELGCSMFWNFNSKEGTIDNVHRACINLLNNKKYCFIVAHNIADLKKWKKLFPNANIIELINDSVVNQLSVKLKNGVEAKPNPTWPNSIKFDIGSLFNEELFFANIKLLLSKFNLLDNKMDDRVYEFYKKYVNLYK